MVAVVTAVPSSAVRRFFVARSLRSSMAGSGDARFALDFTAFEVFALVVGAVSSSESESEEEDSEEESDLGFDLGVDLGFVLASDSDEELSSLELELDSESLGIGSALLPTTFLAEIFTGWAFTLAFALAFSVELSSSLDSASLALDSSFEESVALESPTAGACFSEASSLLELLDFLMGLASSISSSESESSSSGRSKL